MTESILVIPSTTILSVARGLEWGYRSISKPLLLEVPANTTLKTNNMSQQQTIQ